MDNKHNDRRIFDLAMHTWLRYALVFLKWLLWAAVIGMALGFISTAFHYSVDFAQELRLAYPWLLCLLPAGGLIIVFMYRACGVKDDRGANAVLEATINGEPVKKRVAPLIFTGTVLTHLFGGSAGREGAASTGRSWRRRMPLRARASCPIAPSCWWPTAPPRAWSAPRAAPGPIAWSEPARIFMPA